MDLMNITRGTVAIFLNSPVKLLANFVGINDSRIDQIYIDLMNRINETRFRSVPASEIMIFLPQCLRNSKCPGPLDDEGYHCRECGRCKIADVMKIARRLESKVFILPGGSIVPRLLKKYNPKAVVGVACFRELSMAVSIVTRMNIPLQAIYLLRDGCRNTDFNLYELKEVLNNGRGSK